MTLGRGLRALLLAAALCGRVSPILQAQTTREEAVLWTSIKDSKDAEDYRGYLDKYPDGTFAPIAKRRIAALSTAKLGNLAGSTWDFRFDWTEGRNREPKFSTGQISFAADGSCAFTGQGPQPCKWVKQDQIVTITEVETKQYYGSVWRVTMDGNKMSGMVDNLCKGNSCYGSKTVNLTARQ